MSQFFLYTPELNFYVIEIKHQTVGECLFNHIHSPSSEDEDVYITHNGKLVSPDDCASPEAVYRMEPRLPGGKGGFGSMLRAIGARIDKTKSREACRDLSGRRMRDVNNEKKLREWIAKKAERETDKEDKKKARWERMKAEPKHRFDDSEYMDQKTKVSEDLEDALQAGLMKASSTSASDDDAQKNKKSKHASHSMKKAAEWLGLDVENLSDIDSDLTDSEDETDVSRIAELGSICDDRSIISDFTADDSVILPDSSTEEPQAKRLKTSDEDSAQPAEVDVAADEDSAKEDLSSSTQPAEPPKDIDLDEVASIEQLLALGLDALKADLMRRGLKCGGTLQERATRLFSVKGLAVEDIPSALVAKPSKGKGKGKSSR